jgi:hypothetical protein
MLTDCRIVWLQERNDARPLLTVISVEERRPTLPVLDFDSGAAVDELNHDLK